jgi:hypothetical protein
MPIFVLMYRTWHLVMPTMCSIRVSLQQSKFANASYVPLQYGKCIFTELANTSHASKMQRKCYKGCCKTDTRIPLSECQTIAHSSRLPTPKGWNISWKAMDVGRPRSLCTIMEGWNRTSALPSVPDVLLHTIHYNNSVRSVQELASHDSSATRASVNGFCTPPWNITVYTFIRRLNRASPGLKVKLSL